MNFRPKPQCTMNSTHGLPGKDRLSCLAYSPKLTSRTSRTCEKQKSPPAGSKWPDVGRPRVTAGSKTRSHSTRDVCGVMASSIYRSAVDLRHCRHVVCLATAAQSRREQPWPSMSVLPLLQNGPTTRGRSEAHWTQAAQLSTALGNRECNEPSR